MTGGRRIVVSMDDQKLEVIEGGRCVAAFDISTAEKGMGHVEGSHRTPTGSFRICGKTGDGEPCGTIFRGRKPCGIWHPGDPSGDDLVLTRILRLDGLDPWNRNTLDRFIYIHGTNNEEAVGSRAGHGCVRLRNHDMILLHDMMNEDDIVEIRPQTRRCGKLAFLGFDLVLISIDGIGEMARQRGGGVADCYYEILSSMNAGALDPGSAYRAWMELIKPDAALIQSAAAACMNAVPPSVAELAARLRAAGFVPVVLSRSPMELARPVANALGIRHVEAPVVNPQSGRWSYPFLDSLAKLDVVNDWSAAMLPEQVMVIGSGEDDMSTRPAADLLVSCGPPHPACDHHMRFSDDGFPLSDLPTSPDIV